MTKCNNPSVQWLYSRRQVSVNVLGYVTFFTHFGVVALQTVLSFVSDFPRRAAPGPYARLSDEREPLLLPNGAPNKLSEHQTATQKRVWAILLILSDCSSEIDSIHSSIILKISLSYTHTYTLTPVSSSLLVQKTEQVSCPTSLTGGFHRKTQLVSTFACDV